MKLIKFVKDHKNRKFKKGAIVEMVDENIDAWLNSGYAVLYNEDEDTGDVMGNVDASTKVGEDTKENSASGGTSQKKSSKNKKKKRGGK